MTNSSISIYSSPERFSLGEAKVRVGSGIVDRDRGSLNLVTPASKVAKGVNGEADMSLEGKSVDCS